MSNIKHIGAGPFKIEGMENTDKESFDLLNQLAWSKVPDNSVDAYVCHHVLQEFPWRNLVGILVEMHRTLKVGGVVRMGIPHIDSGKGVQFLLSWGNINLFSEDLMSKVLSEIGFVVRRAEYQKTHSDLPLITKADNRPDESLYLEGYKL